MDAEHVAMEVIQSRGRGGVPETLLAIYCVDQKDYIFQTADYWVMQVPSCLPCCPKMNITFSKRTEFKTPEIAEQLELLGEPWVRYAAWHRVLCFPIPPEVDYNLANFSAIGVGSNCIKRERASKLALALTVAVYQPLNARYRPEELERLTTRAEAILPRRHPLLWPTTINALAVPYFERRGDFSMRTYQAEWLHDDSVVRAQGDLYDDVMNMMESAQPEQPQTSQPPPVTNYASCAPAQWEHQPHLQPLPADVDLLTQPVFSGPAGHGAAQPDQWQLLQPPLRATSQLAPVPPLITSSSLQANWRYAFPAGGCRPWSIDSTRAE